MDETQLTPEQGSFVRSYFRREVRSKLTPLMVRDKVRFPELRDKSIYLATRLRTKSGKNDRFALIEVPTTRFRGSYLCRKWAASSTSSFWKT